MSGRWTGGMRASSGTTQWTHWPFGLGRLSGIGAQQAIFERSPVKAADDGVHLLRVRGIYERESFGFLRLGIADHFNCVRNQVLGSKPGPDIVRGHPGGQIAQKNGKTHSTVVFDSIRQGNASTRSMEATLCYHTPSSR